MSRKVTILKNSVFAYIEETVRGTAETDSVNDIVLVRTDTAPSWVVDREILETQYMNSVLGRSAPQVGMYNEDIGFTLNVFARGSGVQGTAPDYSPLLKHAMGAVVTPTGGVIAASPTPTSTTFTVTGGSGFVKNAIVRVEYATDTYAIRRVTDVSGGNALTVRPPLPAIPAEGGDVDTTVSHILKSDYDDFYTGTGYFYHDGDKKDIFTGCMGSNLSITLEVGQFIGMEFQSQALDYDYEETAIGYTVTPSDYNNTPPLKCLGIEIPIYYSGTVVTGSTATSVIITSDGGVEVEIGDQIIVYVAASSDYETRTVTNVSGSGVGNKTCTVSALSGAPAAGAAVKIMHVECVPSMTISLENTIDKDMCMHTNSGYNDQAITDRVVNVTSDNVRWKTILEMTMRDNVVSAEIWAIAGTTAGNIFAICIPNFYYTELPRGDDNGKITQAWNGMAVVGTNGNDEFAIGHL
jgi:hypothetical protein